MFEGDDPAIQEEAFPTYNHFLEALPPDLEQIILCYVSTDDLYKHNKLSTPILLRHGMYYTFQQCQQIINDLLKTDCIYIHPEYIFGQFLQLHQLKEDLEFNLVSRTEDNESKYNKITPYELQQVWIYRINDFQYIFADMLFYRLQVHETIVVNPARLENVKSEFVDTTSLYRSFLLSILQHIDMKSELYFNVLKYCLTLVKNLFQFKDIPTPVQVSSCIYDRMFDESGEIRVMWRTLKNNGETPFILMNEIHLLGVALWIHTIRQGKVTIQSPSHSIQELKELKQKEIDIPVFNLSFLEDLQDGVDSISEIDEKEEIKTEKKTPFLKKQSQSQQPWESRTSFHIVDECKQLMMMFKMANYEQKEDGHILYDLLRHLIPPLLTLSRFSNESLLKFIMKEFNEIMQESQLNTDQLLLQRPNRRNNNLRHNANPQRAPVVKSGGKISQLFVTQMDLSRFTTLNPQQLIYIKNPILTLDLHKLISPDFNWEVQSSSCLEHLDAQVNNPRKGNVLFYRNNRGAPFYSTREIGGGVWGYPYLPECMHSYDFLLSPIQDQGYQQQYAQDPRKKNSLYLVQKLAQLLPFVYKHERWHAYLEEFLRGLFKTRFGHKPDSTQSLFNQSSDIKQPKELKELNLENPEFEEKEEYVEDFGDRPGLFCPETFYRFLKHMSFLLENENPTILYHHFKWGRIIIRWLIREKRHVLTRFGSKPSQGFTKVYYPMQTMSEMHTILYHHLGDSTAMRWRYVEPDMPTEIPISYGKHIQKEENEKFDLAASRGLILFRRRCITMVPINLFMETLLVIYMVLGCVLGFDWFLSGGDLSDRLIWMYEFFQQWMPGYNQDSILIQILARGFYKLFGLFIAFFIIPEMGVYLRSFYIQRKLASLTLDSTTRKQLEYYLVPKIKRYTIDLLNHLYYYHQCMKALYQVPECKGTIENLYQDYLSKHALFAISKIGGISISQLAILSKGRYDIDLCAQGIFDYDRRSMLYYWLCQETFTKTTPLLLDRLKSFYRNSTYMSTWESRLIPILAWIEWGQSTRSSSSRIHIERSKLFQMEMESWKNKRWFSPLCHKWSLWTQWWANVGYTKYFKY